MKRFGFLCLLAVAFTTALFMFGCSDDEGGPTGPKIQAGQPDDPDYLLVREVVHPQFFLELTQIMLRLSAITMEMVLDSAAALPVSREFADKLGIQLPGLIYHEDSKYWCLIASGPLGDMSVIVDSIQFLHASGPVQWPESSLVVGLNTGCVLVVIAGALMTMGQRLAITGDIVDLGNVTVNGTQYVDYPLGDVPSKQGIICIGDLTASGQITNLAIQLDEFVESGGCPVGGGMDYSMYLHGICETDGIFSLDQFWQVNKSFDLGTISTSYTCENTRWVDTVLCVSKSVGRQPLFDQITEAIR